MQDVIRPDVGMYPFECKQGLGPGVHQAASLASGAMPR
jgi:hypothetical protein